MKTIRVQVETNDGCTTILVWKSKLKNPTESICKRVNEQLQGLNIKRVEVSAVHLPQCDSQTSGTNRLTFSPICPYYYPNKQISQMRKIERLMNAAITAGKDFSLC